MSGRDASQNDLEVEDRLIAALRDEAYRVPSALSADDLRAMAVHSRTSAASSVWRLVGVLLLAGLMLGGGYAAWRSASGPGSSAESGCNVSSVIRYGSSWWTEIGGPDAFFHGTPRNFYYADGAEMWLLMVRVVPRPSAGEELRVWAESVESGQRSHAVLNSELDPQNIYRHDQRAPQLDGGWYLFEQRFPHPGCWRLTAAVDERIVGTATVDVWVGRPPATPDPDAQTPQLASPVPRRSPSQSWYFPHTRADGHAAQAERS